MTDSPNARNRLRETLSSVFAIAAIAAVLGTAANVISPRRIPWVEDWSHYIEARALQEGLTLITTAEAWEYFQRGTHIFLDARSDEEYRQERIPGAFSLPFMAMEEKMPEVQFLLGPSFPIVTYCSGETCDESFLVAVELRKQGMTNIVLYAGGMEKWVEAGHPSERGP
jgi:rhodanese-related sulfurtransferase